jgi:hypothetical protein
MVNVKRSCSGKGLLISKGKIDQIEKRPSGSDGRFLKTYQLSA